MKYLAFKFRMTLVTFLTGFLQIVDGLIKILTLGLFATEFSSLFYMRSHSWVIGQKLTTTDRYQIIMSAVKHLKEMD